MHFLDVSFFGPLKLVNKRESESFVEKVTTRYDIASLLTKTFNYIVPISKEETVSRATGIFPIKVLSEGHFVLT